MRLRLGFCIVLILPCLFAYGNPVRDVDSIQFPEKILNLPSVVVKEGDRAGSWGLPTLVAIRYGLTVNETLDERLSDEASTQVAYRYLADLYQAFGDWDLCFMAYLYSPAYVRNLQARHMDSVLYNFDRNRYISSYRSKPAPKPAPIVKEDKKTNPTPPKKEPKCVTYTVKSGDTLSKIAKKYKVTVNDIKKWNNLKSDLIRENQKLKIYQ